MSIYKSSRYEYSVVDYVQTETDGPENPIVFYDISTFYNVTYYEHPYVQGERLDQISNKYYKTPGYWWAIVELNTHVEDFLNIPDGTILKVPRV